MDKEVSFWDAFSFLDFFEKLGTSWVSGAGTGAPPGVVSEAFIFEEPTPLVATILQEVKTGWTAGTILDLWGPFYPIAIFVSLIMTSIILYCIVRVLQIRRAETIALRAITHPIAEQDLPRVQMRWQRIEEHLGAEEPQRWRTAILEADHMLNELLDLQGYKGETMADKMRQVPVEAFKTIDFAWEAHQVRNKIAHDTNYALDAREAKRVIKMYERIFKEFNFIGSE